MGIGEGGLSLPLLCSLDCLSYCEKVPLKCTGGRGEKVGWLGCPCCRFESKNAPFYCSANGRLSLVAVSRSIA